MKENVVILSAEQREQLQEMIDQGKESATVRKRARVLLEADQGEFGPARKDTDVAQFAQVGLSTVERVRRKFVTFGFEVAVFHQTNRNRVYRKLDGTDEAQLIALACSTPPEGRCRWTIRLLADKLVELGVVESISNETVRATLKKTNLNLT